MITLADAAYAYMARLVEPGKVRYCKWHGFDFIAYDAPLDHQRAAPWSKIIALQNHLDEYDWLFWTDVDSLILNERISLMDYVTLMGDQDCAFVRDPNGINSGNFLIRSCEWTRQYLARVYDQTQFVHDIWWENRAIIHLYATDPEVRRRTKVFGDAPDGSYAPQLRAGFNGYFIYGEWNAAVMHLPGIHHPQRAALIEELTEKAKEPLPERLFSREDLGTALNGMGLIGSGVEVGVWRGDFARVILDRWQGAKLYLVDAWRHLDDYRDVSNSSDAEHEYNYQATLRAIGPYQSRVEVVRDLSAAAAPQFRDGSLDFVYIDANHKYEHVCQDLALWYPKVKPGGLFAGHDYLDGARPEGDFGVKRAVDSFASELGVPVRHTMEGDWRSWYYRKPTSTNG